MSKSKKYSVDKSDINPLYAPKEDASKTHNDAIKLRKKIQKDELKKLREANGETTNSNSRTHTKKKESQAEIKMYSKSASTRQVLINEDEFYEEQKIVIGRSVSSKLFLYIDNLNMLIQITEGKTDTYQSHINSAYNTLSDGNEILSKHEAFRRMKEKSSVCDYVIRNVDNAQISQPHKLRLAEHIRAYLYAIIYPPVFEVCTETSADIIYTQYPMVLDLWCNMLEDAIILDGICDALHISFLKLLNPTYDNIPYDKISSTYDAATFFSELPSNDKYLIIQLYKPYIEFACNAVNQLITYENNHNGRTIKGIINYDFIQSGNRGIKAKKAIINCIGEISKFHTNNKIRNKDEQLKLTNFLRLYKQYNFQRQLHMFDFIWHSQFDKVDFHLTNGFITNYVLYKIMEQNDEIYKKLNITHDSEKFSFGKKYTCKSAMELFLKDSIETFDLDFINHLIRTCSSTVQKYDLGAEKCQANYLRSFMCNSMDSKLIDDFVSCLDRLYSDNFSDKIKNIFRSSLDYYRQIYEDTHYR